MKYPVDIHSFDAKSLWRRAVLPAVCLTPLLCPSLPFPLRAAFTFSTLGWAAWWRGKQANFALGAQQQAEHSAERTSHTQRMEQLTARCEAQDIQLQQWGEQQSAQDAQIQALEAQATDWEAEAEAQKAQREAIEAALQEAQAREADAESSQALYSAEHQQLSQRVCTMADSLTGQVVTALSEAEQAISTAIEGFTHIANEAADAAGLAQQTVGMQTEGGVSQVAEQATRVMGQFIQGMLLSARKISDTSRQLQRMVAVSDNLNTLLDDVEGVASQTALIALNASIEAARAGEAGRAFRVVADEVRKLSERSRQASERMRSLTQQTSSETETIYKELATTAETCLEASCNAQVEVNRLLELVGEAGEQTKVVLSQLAEKSGNIMAKYTGIVTAFQFHDLLRQRLEHVADPLYALRRELSGEVDAEAEPQLAYAVGQNTFHARAVGIAPTLEIVHYSADDDDSITLF